MHVWKRSTGVALICMFLCLWTTIILLITSSISDVQITDEYRTIGFQAKAKALDTDSAGAFPVVGTYARLVSNTTETVFAIPATKHIKGVIVLLHACTHNALKFFSPSPKCVLCIGLSEELRIASILLAREYAILAISSGDRISGCWSNHDKANVQAAFAEFQTMLNLFQDNSEQRTYNSIAIGASSGGKFAAELAADGIVQSALVMVMSLGPILRERLTTMGSKMPHIYLAPMPRDARVTQATVADFQKMANVLGRASERRLVLDTTTCVSLPVTAQYLHGRVPHMKQDMAEKIVQALVNAQHLDSDLFLIKDPTSSNWRSVLQESCDEKCLEHQCLEPGLSPLAKALHRAWAFHEYCSEVIDKALDCFENTQVNFVDG